MPVMICAQYRKSPSRTVHAVVRTRQDVPYFTIFNTPPKVAATSLLIKFHVIPVEISQENSSKPISWPIFTYLGTYNGRKIRLLKPMFYTLWKSFQWACKARLIWPQWMLFDKITKNLNFYSFGGSKWPNNLFYISKSSCKLHLLLQFLKDTFAYFYSNFIKVWSSGSNCHHWFWWRLGATGDKPSPKPKLTNMP